MKQLYPEIEPYKASTFKADQFSIYYEESGNPEGAPILFLHGGPGSGCSPKSRRFFNPEKYRIVMFDQRGCGRSEPLGDLENNSTGKILEDIEQLRELLGIEIWSVFGGSWGSTLALLYAEKFPENVTNIIVEGVFLASKEEMDWYYMPDGVARFFPEVYEEMISLVPESERRSYVNIASFYQTLLTSKDESTRSDAVYLWSKFQNRFAGLNIDLDELEKSCHSVPSANKALVANFYHTQEFFIQDNQIIENIDRIKDIPLSIIQGRYDMICPPIYAVRLAKAHGNAKLFMAEDSGHICSDTALSYIIQATDDI